MTTYDDILRANATLHPIDVKGRMYTPVTERIKAFRMIHPDGGISTEIVSMADGIVVMRAVVADADGKVLGVGTAYEKESSSYINKTSYVENCETSAVGRALGMAGYGIDASMASAEELLNAMKQQDDIKQQEQQATAAMVQAEPAYIKKQEEVRCFQELGLNFNSKEDREKFGSMLQALKHGKVVPDKTLSGMTDEEHRAALKAIIMNFKDGLEAMKR